MSQNICKVVLVGESGVGKTSLISQFIEQEFYELQTSTTGATFSTKLINVEKYNTEILLEIWDTAGQERFRSMSKIFYKEAAIAILVYDITKQQTFTELNNYWLNAISQSAPEDVILGVSANKSDLVDYEEVDENEARNFAKEIGAVFKPTSAKSNAGIDELFNELGQKYVEYKIKSGKQGSLSINEGKKKLKRNGDNTDTCCG